MTPDYSPNMLRFFLRARVEHAGRQAAFINPLNKASGMRAEKRRIVKSAGVSANDFDMAWMGMNIPGGKRARLWLALGVSPAAFGVVLTDDGGQEPFSDAVARELAKQNPEGDAA